MTPTLEELKELSKSELLALDGAEGARKGWSNDKIIAYILDGVESVTFELPNGALKRIVRHESGDIVFEDGTYTTSDSVVAQHLYDAGYDPIGGESEERPPLPTLVG